jgi:hypothetical protein
VELEDVGPVVERAVKEVNDSLDKPLLKMSSGIASTVPLSVTPFDFHRHPLAAVKDEPATPVVILTTSEQEEEILKMYKMRCSSYIVKPVDFDKFLKVVRTIAEYWFTVVVLPKSASELSLSNVRKP